MTRHAILILLVISAGCMVGEEPIVEGGGDEVVAGVEVEEPEEQDTQEVDHIEAARCYSAGDYLDGYPLFSPRCNAGSTPFWTGNGKTGGDTKRYSSWVRTGWQWQCMEWVVRYFHFAKHVSASIWDGVPYAKDMCARATYRTSWVKRLGPTATVRPGDMVVYDGTKGHVAIVGAVNAGNTSVLTFNENTWANYVGGTPLYRWWRPKSAAKCYIRSIR
jgi:hypothetical protein